MNLHRTVSTADWRRGEGVRRGGALGDFPGARRMPLVSWDGPTPQSTARCSPTTGSSASFAGPILLLAGAWELPLRTCGASSARCDDRSRSTPLGLASHLPGPCQSPRGNHRRPSELHARGHCRLRHAVRDQGGVRHGPELLRGLQGILERPVAGGPVVAVWVLCRDLVEERQRFVLCVLGLVQGHRRQVGGDAPPDLPGDLLGVLRGPSGASKCRLGATISQAGLSGSRCPVYACGRIAPGTAPSTGAPVQIRVGMVDPAAQAGRAAVAPFSLSPVPMRA